MIFYATRAGGSDMKRPLESEYTSQVAYTRALEAYCDSLAKDEKGLFIDLIAQHDGLAEEMAQPEQEPLEELRQMMQIEVDRLIAAKAPKRQPLTLNEISAMEEKVYMRTTHKGKPLFKYAQALIRATEAAHNIGENK
jgi:transketolase C-terminal domain/subunit